MDWENKSIEELRELVAYHDLCYWTLNSPEISDADYDRLVETLRKKSPGDKIVNGIQTIMVSTSKIHHAPPMLPMIKVNSFAEILAWADKYCRTPEENLFVSPKYDGVAADWSFGILSTRGDGFEGDDISDKITMIMLAPKTGMAYPLQNCEESLRGEILMTKKEFKDHSGKFPTPHEAVETILKRQDLDGNFRLTLVDWRRYEVPLKRKELTSARWETLRTQFAALSYPQDGMVVRLADEKYAKSLGNTENRPNSAIVFQFD